MPLSGGTRLGPYEIQSALGAGGMGEVYRARDTRLDRIVAIKILPAALAADPQFRARFDREARAISQLTHPSICTLYDVGEHDGTAFLVMELLDGETLADRLTKGALPLAQALTIAVEVASALDAAHRAGIVHRDLKPGNVMLTKAGAKLLDFGLAKTSDPVVAASGTMVPTTPANITAQGTILGTFQYMAPEQIEGIEADARTDIFAFGCVLFEMLTGQKAFEGKTRASLLGAIMHAEPPAVSQVQPVAPAALDRIVARCLTKDPDDRWQSARDLMYALKWVAEGGVSLASAAQATSLAPRSAWSRALPWTLAASTLVLAIALVLLWAPWRAAVPPRITRTTITTSGPSALTIDRLGGDLALSPDGTHVVYVGNRGTQLFVRALDALEPVAIATGRSLRGQFVSPDGQWVGFLDGVVTLRKVAITGGPPITLASLDEGARGATWAPDDTIIFATNNPATGLQRVSAAGGTPEVLTRPDRAHGEADHLWPEILPGGHAVLFTITSQTGGLETAQVAVRDLRSGTQKVLLRGGSHGHYLPSGHLVYVASGTLRAIPFDPTRLETHGSAVPVLSRLVTKDTGTGDFAVATDGTLVYLDAPGGLAAANARTLVWVDRSGKEEPVAAPPRGYQHPRLSPDGTRVALSSLDEESDLWIWDLRRAPLTRLTLDPGLDWFPTWTPDGRRIVFSSNRGGAMNLWWQAADGTGAAERLTTRVAAEFVTGITPDGTAVVFSEATPTMGRDLLQLALDGTRRVTPLLQTKFDEYNGIVSPDGRWLAYESNSSGPFEIYVRPLPNVGGGQWQVSTAGGTRPLWARSGKELFYVGADGALLRVPVEASGTTWSAGTPTKLLEGRYYAGDGASAGRAYDVSPDGQRFLMIKASGTDAGAAPPALIVVQHWDEELKRLVPPK
jgi:serine/threonine-protein kinase